MLYFCFELTVKGTKRVNVKLKKGGAQLMEHMKNIMNFSGIKESQDFDKTLDEKGKVK